MLKIENTEVLGWEHAIRGMRNPMNSWAKSDSYEVLANIYKSRRNHKLDEWHTFCDWIEGLPYSELITGGTTDE